MTSNLNVSIVLLFLILVGIFGIFYIRGRGRRRLSQLYFSNPFPARPVIVRLGRVVRRQTRYQSVIASSAMRNIRAPQIPFYQFHIDCNDDLGTDEIVVLVEKNAENELAIEGRLVEVTSQQSRFDFGYSHRSVALV